MKKYYKISEISALFGIGNDSLRYYERKGILSPKRGENDYRFYSLRDIWKLNVIKDLRELDFSTETIKEYLDNRQISTTLALLKKEEALIEEKIERLKKQEESIKKRYSSIENSLKIETDIVQIKHYDERYLSVIHDRVNLDEEIDFLLQRLHKDSEENLHIVGNSRIGSVLDSEFWREGVANHFSSVFIETEKGKHNFSLPAGDYLCVIYRGSYQKSGDYLKLLLTWVKENGCEILSNPVELYLLDIHETSNSQEFLTELQIQLSQGL